MAEYDTWMQEDAWWRTNYASRPYAAGRTYEELRAAYQYGYECALQHKGGRWDDITADLRTGWDRFEGKGPGGAAWENIKDALRDAWDRITGKHDLDPTKMSESEVERLSHGGRPR
jgi:hypothetical protein